MRIPSPVSYSDLPPEFVSKQPGFSLVELLAVIAVMSILMTLCLPAVTSRSHSGRLTAAGNLMVDLAKLARQNSLTKNASTALVIATGNGADSSLNNRAACLVERTSGGSGWTSVSRWYLLPDGIVVDPAQTTGFLSDPKFGNLSFRGKPVTTYIYQIFRSDGSLEGNLITPPALHLMASQGGSGNYYDVVLNLFTGLAKVDRP